MSFVTQGITIGGKHSYRDFGVMISEAQIGLPTRVNVTETVPYMDGYYDFSALAGEVTYTDRSLAYTFELSADTQEELVSLKNAMAQWLLPVQQTSIQDDTDPDYHFVGSCSKIEWEESWLEGKLKVTFNCQPFRVPNLGTNLEVI